MRPASFCAWLLLLALAVGDVHAAEPVVPDTLDGLVAVALQRHPEIAALESDADSARAATLASGRLMDPQWMLGAQALGAMPDSADPTMFMVGVEQMVSLPSAYRAPRTRAALDVRWAETQRARVEADVKEALWEAAARLRAQIEQGNALDQQIAAAEAALAFGRVRYSAGAGTAAPVSPGGGATPEPPPVPPPTVVPPKSSGGGMSGMGGGQRGAPGMKGMPEGGGMAEMGAAMPSGMSAPMGADGLAALLRLDAEVARVRAERDALTARQAGEEARLALIVGDDAARAVATNPAPFLGGADSSAAQPERALAATSIDMAEADAQVARAGRLPTFMIGADLRVMPEGMVDGVDAQLGVTIPIWSGARRRVEAADASAAAAASRSQVVDRALADAIVAARAEQAAAEARARALSDIAGPRARAAWDATVAVWAAGGGSTSDLVATWQTAVAVTRDVSDAELAVELARARLARLEGR